MKKIQFLAASDRNNYGDLLFPIITKKMILKNCKVRFENYAMIDSDLGYFGALPTKSYKKLKNENNSNSIVIIGGGHVFFVNRNTLYSHINKKHLSLTKNRFINKIYRLIHFPRLIFTKSNIPPLLLLIT